MLLIHAYTHTRIVVGIFCTQILNTFFVMYLDKLEHNFLDTRWWSITYAIRSVDMCVHVCVCVF